MYETVRRTVKYKVQVGKPRDLPWCGVTLKKEGKRKALRMIETIIPISRKSEYHTYR